jgi:hypothetical protein
MSDTNNTLPTQAEELNIDALSDAIEAQLDDIVGGGGHSRHSEHSKTVIEASVG